MTQTLSYPTGFAVLVGLVGCSLLLSGPAARAAEPNYVQLVCMPELQDAGRMEPDAASDLLRWPDGTLRLLDQGSEYYATEVEEAPLPEWIDVFGAQAQRGSSEIGFVRSDNLTCAPL